MLLTEAQHRDAVLRSYFDGRDWDKNDEFMLKRSFVGRSSELLPAFPLLVDDEWDVEPGKSNQGKGDLVFTDGHGGFAVVEVKFIDNSRTGHTIRVKRNKSRGLVLHQALRYARIIEARDDVVGHVPAYAYTNENPDELVEVIPAQ